jgi:ActR/RegA family two-component response regulator
VTRLADALKRLGNERFEVVLLDLSLPDGNGLEVFDQVFKAAPDSLVLVLSGLTDEETAREAMARGAHDYFSKGYLGRFPIDTLKIDQSFVRDICTDTDNATIVAAVIGMGKSLKLRVIAEGVETHEQFAFLQARHCGEGQGFHFSQPMSAEAFARLLGTGN